MPPLLYVHVGLHTRGTSDRANIYPEKCFTVLPPQSAWLGMKARHTGPLPEDRKWIPLLNIFSAFMRWCWWKCVSFAVEDSLSRALLAQPAPGSEKWVQRLASGDLGEQRSSWSHLIFKGAKSHSSRKDPLDQKGGITLVLDPRPAAVQTSVLSPQHWSLTFELYHPGLLHGVELHPRRTISKPLACA